MSPDEHVFKALADPTRRAMLDKLHEKAGQTLGELCEGFGMARQSAAQHLEILEAANMVASVRRGREKLHYLNPIPLHEMQERWIDKFERPRLRTLSTIKQKAEQSMTDRPTFVYVIYIEGTAEKVWQALTDADMTAAYWGHRNESDWQAGSRWDHMRTDGSGVSDTGGTVVESSRPRRLVVTFEDPNAPTVDPSRVTFDIETYESIVRLTVTHENLPDDAALTAVRLGWPAVLSNMKSFIETGQALPQEPWAMP